MLCTRRRENGIIAISVVNKHPSERRKIALPVTGKACRVLTVNGDSAEAYNDVNLTQVSRTETPWMPLDAGTTVEVAPRSVNVIQIR